MKVLHLNLHREFFAQIAAGTKRTKDPRCTPYRRRRLEGRHYYGGLHSEEFSHYEEMSRDQEAKLVEEYKKHRKAQQQE